MSTVKNRKALFFLATLLILFQILFFIIYANYSQYLAKNDITNLLLQQNMQLVQRAKLSKSPEKIVQKSHIPNSTITVSSNPQWTVQDTSSSFWGILNKMKHQNPPIRISIKIKDNQWLNIEIIPLLTHAISRYLFIGFEILLNLFLILFLWSLYRHTVPLRIIENAAKRLGIDMNTQPLKMRGSTVARQAFRSINDMQEKIKNLIQERTIMMASISHDLRTPLTSMRLRNELITDHEIRGKNHKDIDEMEAMVSQILTFSKEDYLSSIKNNIDLTAVIISICHDYQDSGHPVTFIGCENTRIIFHGCLLSLKRAFTNIIDNAIKFGDSAAINLVIDNKIKIIIHDNGPGILDKHLDKVLLPFYRADLSRSRKKSGIGLGLAIAKNIIHSHGGEIILEQAKPIGLKVNILLPFPANNISNITI